MKLGIGLWGCGAVYKLAVPYRRGLRLHDFAWSAWWTNTVLMGVQMGDAFGSEFAKALCLPGGAEAPWRVRHVG